MTKGIMSENKCNKKKTWEKTIRVGDMSKRVEVREIENGFIVELNKDGEVPDKDGGNKYIHISKEFFSKINPLADKDVDIMEEAKETAKSLGIDLMFE